MNVIWHQAVDRTREPVPKSRVGQYFTKLIIKDRDQPAGLATFNSHDPMNIRLSTIVSRLKPWQSVLWLVSHKLDSQQDCASIIGKDVYCSHPSPDGGGFSVIPLPLGSSSYVATRRQTVDRGCVRRSTIWRWWLRDYGGYETIGLAVGKDCC